MFDIGFWELLIIGIVALVVLGPERLPSAIRSTMETVRSVKNMANGFKQEVSHQLKTHELHEHLRKAEQEGLSQVGDDVKQSIAELKAAAASVQSPYKAGNEGLSIGSFDDHAHHDGDTDEHLNKQNIQNHGDVEAQDEISSLEEKKPTDV